MIESSLVFDGSFQSEGTGLVLLTSNSSSVLCIEVGINFIKKIERRRIALLNSKD